MCRSVSLRVLSRARVVALMAGVIGHGSAWGQALSVTSVEPALNALAAATSDNIVVHFDRALDPATVSTDTFWAFARWSGSVDGVITLTDGNQTMTLDPTRDLSSGEQVMVILSHDLRAADGSAMRDGGYSFQYWTRAAPSTLDFQTIAVISTNVTKAESSQPYGGIATDLDGDGWLDLAMVNEITEDLRVYMNAADGLGTFEPVLLPSTPLGNFASP